MKAIADELGEECIGDEEEGQDEIGEMGRRRLYAWKSHATKIMDVEEVRWERGWYDDDRDDEAELVMEMVSVAERRAQTPHANSTPRFGLPRSKWPDR